MSSQKYFPRKSATHIYEFIIIYSLTDASTLAGCECYMSELESERSRVNKIITRISEVEEVGWSEARRMLHKYVCEGKCGWYRAKSREAGFDRMDLTEKQRGLIESLVKQIMRDVEIEEAKWRIHSILCPGHPRPRPRKV